MSQLRSVCVYCGSGLGTDPAYAETAHMLGRELAHNGVRLVYGGGSIGLMGVIAQSVLEHGGRVTGIIPKFLREQEVMLEAAHELIVTDDMHERKRLMFERADAFVALPGGIGTLEELVEQLTWAQLGRHDKPILLADINGFWRPLIELIRHMDQEEFIRNGFEINFLVAEQAEDILPRLAKACAEIAGPEPTFESEPLRNM